LTDNPFETAAWNQYEDRVRKDLIPKLRASAISMVLNPGSDPDVKVAVELGMSILLDKPIIIIAEPGQRISPAFKRVADTVIRVRLDDPDAGNQVSAAVNEVMRKRGLA